MQQLLNFWYIASPQWVWERFTSSIQFFEGQIAVESTLKNITKPIFQDYTYQGRIIGFMLRLVRIFFGGILYLLIGIAYIFSYAVWLAFPFICLVSLISSVAAR